MTSSQSDEALAQETPFDDERELVSGLKRYDDAAIRQVYRLYADSLYRYAIYHLGDQASAEDVVGEVFLRLLNSIDRYEYRGLPLQAYLYRIARNLIVDQQRRRNRVAPLEAMPPGRTLSVDALRLAEERLTWHDLQRALAKLTEEQRQVVLLKFVEDLDNKEVAALIGKNEGSVKSLQHRALLSLRRILERQPRGN